MSKLTKNQKAVLAKYDKTQVYSLTDINKNYIILKIFKIILSIHLHFQVLKDLL